MLVKILDSCGLAPGFLIGGVPQDFRTVGRLTDSDYFVVEADEYDSAFFDKRSKFVHYFSDTLVVIIWNLITRIFSMTWRRFKNSFTTACALCPAQAQ